MILKYEPGIERNVLAEGIPKWPRREVAQEARCLVDPGWVE